MSIDGEQGGVSGSALLLGDAAPGAGGAGDAGAGGDGGAAAGGADPGAAAAGGDPDWYGQLSAETGDGENASLRDWVKSSGVKDLDGLARIARDNQRALRESGRVKVPDDGASEADIKAFRAAIGVPESAEGYEAPAVQDAAGNPIPLNTPLLQRLAAKAHETGVPKAAYDALVTDFVQAQIEEQAGLESVQKAEAVDWVKAQGDKAPARTAAVDRGVAELGLSAAETAELRNALGSKRVLDMLANLGDRIGEDVLVGGESRAMLVSGAQAQAEIDKMRTDPVILGKMTTPGTPENARYNRLVAAAGEAANRRAREGM